MPGEDLKLRLRRSLRIYLAVFIGLNLLARIVRELAPSWDVPEGWPVSQGKFMLPALVGVPILLALVAGSVWALRRSERVLSGLRWVLAFAIGVLILSNALHGLEEGFVRPVIAPKQDGISYYQDSLAVDSSAEFLRTFNRRQPELGLHTSTHPPGPVLLMFWVRQVLQLPWLVTLVGGLAVLAGSAYACSGLLRNLGIGSEDATFLTAAYLLLAPIQVYSLFSIDAVISALVLAALAAATSHSKVVQIAGLSTALFALLLLSFGNVVLVPVLLFAGVLLGRVWPVALSVALAAGAVLALGPLSGYDHLEAFRTASRLENPRGFMLFADPGSYVATRLENVGEILYFLGPAGCLFLICALRSPAHRTLPGVRIAMAAFLVLIAAFLTGAYRTGETARACNFVYAFVLLAMAPALLEQAPTPAQRRQVLAWTVGFTIVLQALGYYFW